MRPNNRDLPVFLFSLRETNRYHYSRNGYCILQCMYVIFLHHIAIIKIIQYRFGFISVIRAYVIPLFRSVIYIVSSTCIIVIFADCRVDGLQWSNDGSIKMPRRKGEAPLFRRCMFTCKGGTGGFSKEVWEELEPSVPETVVIFYFGVETDYSLVPHGNSSSDSPFVRSPTSLIRRLKESTTTPKQTYVAESLSGTCMYCDNIIKSF